jgi:transcriptional regulator with XRE-family HTH domain
MPTAASSVNRRIAGRVRDLRTERRLSLEELATRSGVSRSMISLVERGESSPTAVVLEKLATGLGVMLATLFDAQEAASDGPSERVSRRKDQSEWHDPASGYVRRNVSPAAAPLLHIVDVRFPAGGRVAFETGARQARTHQQGWVLEGAIDLTVGHKQHRLREGDCLAMELDRPTMFHNPTRKTTRYAVVFAADDTTRSRR